MSHFDGSPAKTIDDVFWKIDEISSQLVSIESSLDDYNLDKELEAIAANAHSADLGVWKILSIAESLKGDTSTFRFIQITLLSIIAWKLF